MNTSKSVLSLSIFAMLLFLFSCNTDKEKSNTAVIKISFQQAEGVQAVIKSTSPFQLDGDTINVNENGDIIFEANIEKPEYFELSFVGGRPKITLYARPGDSLLISAQGVGSIYQTIKFGGNAPVYNDYLLRSKNISDKLNQSLMNLFGQEEKAAMNSLDSARALHADELAALQKNNANIDAYFIKIENSRAIYEWAILHGRYPDYYNYIHKLKGENKVNLSPEFDTYLAEVDLNNEELIILPIYFEFLQSYLRAESGAFYEDDKIQKEYVSFANYQMSIINSKIENSTIKSILAYKSVYDQVDYRGSTDKDSYWDAFTKTCTNDILVEKITNKLAEWKHLDKGAPVKEVKLVDIDGNAVTFEQFKGKWIYIDIWATWCSPCRAEIPVLKGLEEDFHGQDIVFMSISVDREQQPWQKMVKDEELKGVQVWAGQNETIQKFYKVNGIPRFMIFDPQGNIYDANATRPSMGAGDIIKGLLAK